MEDCNNTEFTLPSAPGGLCFDRNDFVKTNFSVDAFLAEHQNVASLETMRDDLGAYLKVLRLAMIELINKDYANFVNLSATLIGFDKAIAKIQVPLQQLNEEALDVKQCLEEAMKELSLWLNQRHSLQKKKQLLKYYGQTVNCLNTLENILKTISEKPFQDQIVLADRASMQYNQLKFYISKCNGLVKAEQNIQFNDIGAKLIQSLYDLLFQFWNDSDENKLVKSLLILSNLDQVTETELLIKKQAVAPLLQDIISESCLQRSKDGLQEIYNRILLLLETKLKLLLTVMEHSKLTFLVKKYNFLINCFWCEVENQLEVNLASIFAPGNPAIFYKRYSESMQFIRKLEGYCQNKETVNLLRKTAEYKSFQRRWNLPVYFQIRFQEIAGSFEATLQSKPTIENKDEFILKESLSCWKALEESWSDGVYIEALVHKFWKLSLQILSRYSTWASSACIQKSKPDTTNLNRDLIDCSIHIYVDIQTMLKKLPQFLKLVETKVPVDNKDHLRQSLTFSQEMLKETNNTVKKCIVNELFNNCNVQLKQVNEIPRLYRKTNRNVPTKPCGYIDMVSKTLHAFNDEISKRVDNVLAVEVFETLFNMLTVSYYKYVEDVLTSVQKTEESLRRLKQIRDMGSQQNNESVGITDGDKIRLQLNVDVVSYGRLAESVHVDVHKMEKYIDLSSMVTNAVKKLDIK